MRNNSVGIYLIELRYKELKSNLLGRVTKIILFGFTRTLDGIPKTVIIYVYFFGFALHPPRRLGIDDLDLVVNCKKSMYWVSGGCIPARDLYTISESIRVKLLFYFRERNNCFKKTQ